MITSASNSQVKQIIQLNKKSRERKKQGVFLVEGLKMFVEAPKDRLVKTYVAESFLENENHREILQGISYEVVKDSVFAQMSDTLTPQGILTVVKQQEYTLEQWKNLSDTPLFLLLENLQDPGNMEQFFRTAEGAGVTGIIMTKKCVDIYNPKTIRSTMGSIYRMPFVCVEDAEEAMRWFASQGIISYAAHLRGENITMKKIIAGDVHFLLEMKEMVCQITCRKWRRNGLKSPWKVSWSL